MNEEKKFKETRLVIVLIAIIVILVFIVGVLLGERMNQKSLNNKEEIVDKNEKAKSDKDDRIDTEDNENQTDKNNKKNKTEKKVNEEDLVLEARGLIPTHMCGYPAMPLDKKDITIEQLADEIKGQMIISKYTNMDIDHPVHIKEEELTKYFVDLSFLDYLKKNKENQFELDPSILSYSNGEYIVETYATGCEGAYEGDTIEYIDYKLEGDILTLVYAYYYETYNYENQYTTYYKEKDGKVIFDKVTVDEINGENKPLYKGKELSFDQFNKYEFSFDISNNNLRLQKMSYKEV